jgi:uncharacterized protein (TIGR02265 family)
VNSHVNAVRRALGDDGVHALEERFGKPVVFKNSEDVSVGEEVHLIECALDLLTSETFTPDERAFEAGRLHFKNFTTTPLAKIIFSLFRSEFRLMMLQVKNIAGHVFQGVHFGAEELGPNIIRIIMKNNDYPIQHFRGLLTEWMNFSGYHGTVTAVAVDQDTYAYTIEWKEHEDKVKILGGG